MGFKIQKITDNSIIEIISMNIDNENNILVLEDNELNILSVNDFKDMILGSTTNANQPNEKAKPSTYRLVK